ncbi:hypothetical protein PENTCL1PPCAC_23188, partial [Pristionchus entomophagus]
VRMQDNLANTGDFNGLSTHNADFIRMQGQRVAPVRPSSTLANSGQFAGITTHNADFVKKQADICPAEKVLARPNQYNITIRNGHRHIYETGRGNAVRN